MGKPEPTVGGLRDEDVEGGDWERVNYVAHEHTNYQSNPQLREEFLNIARSHGNGRLS